MVIQVLCDVLNIWIIPPLGTEHICFLVYVHFSLLPVVLVLHHQIWEFKTRSFLQHNKKLQAIQEEDQITKHASSAYAVNVYLKFIFTINRSTKGEVSFHLCLKLEDSLCEPKFIRVLHATFSYRQNFYNVLLQSELLTNKEYKMLPALWSGIYLLVILSSNIMHDLLHESNNSFRKGIIIENNGFIYSCQFS